MQAKLLVQIPSEGIKVVDHKDIYFTFKILGQNFCGHFCGHLFNHPVLGERDVTDKEITWQHFPYKVDFAPTICLLFEIGGLHEHITESFFLDNVE